MPLIANSNVADTPFTPAAGSFRIHVVGVATLQAENASGVGFVNVMGCVDLQSLNATIQNDTAGVRYRWVNLAPGSTVRADQ